MTLIGTPVSQSVQSSKLIMYTHPESTESHQSYKKRPAHIPTDIHILQPLTILILLLNKHFETFLHKIRMWINGGSSQKFLFTCSVISGKRKIYNFLFEKYPSLAMFEA